MYEEAINDAEKAILLDRKRYEGYLRRGKRYKLLKVYRTSPTVKCRLHSSIWRMLILRRVEMPWKLSKSKSRRWGLSWRINNWKRLFLPNHNKNHRINNNRFKNQSWSTQNLKIFKVMLLVVVVVMVRYNTNGTKLTWRLELR